jgi:hypothetical protein
MHAARGLSSKPQHGERESRERERERGGREKIERARERESKHLRVDL